LAVIDELISLIPSVLMSTISESNCSQQFIIQHQISTPREQLVEFDFILRVGKPTPSVTVS